MERTHVYAPAIVNPSSMWGALSKIEVLDTEISARDFIDCKIGKLSSLENEPFFVADLDCISRLYSRWLTNLPRVKPFYAVKCNNELIIARMLSSLGTGFDCASKAEIELALSVGVKPDDIIFAHTTKSLPHIAYARTQGVKKMTFDDDEELLKISSCHPEAQLVMRIAVDDSQSMLRLSSKFGVQLCDAGRLLERAAELGLQVIGVSFHVGSGCTQGLAFKQAITDARKVFDLAKLSNFQMSLLDIGGGLTCLESTQDQFDEFCQVINEALEEFFPPESGVTIIAEPGRYFVESAFTLAVNVIAKKILIKYGEQGKLDKTMMYYINDGVYGSLNCILNAPGYEKIEPYPHRAVESGEQMYRSVIWGPTCDSNDKVTEDYWMPELRVGDWLLIDSFGAYTCSLSTEFNGFEKAKIYPIMSAGLFHSFTTSEE